MNKKADKDYEALVEHYEDALMRLISYRVAQKDEKHLLQGAEESVESDGLEAPKESCATPKRSPAPCAEGAGDEASQRRSHRLFTVAQAAVIAILAASLLFCSAYALNEEFRIGTLNFFLELRENGMWFSRNRGAGEGGVSQPQTSGVEEEFPFEFTYIPEGYELYVKECYDQGANGIRYLCAYGYPGQEFNNFSFEILTISEGLRLLVDTEDAEVKNVKIHGYDGQIVQKVDALSGEPETIYIWFNLEDHLGFIFTSMGILAEESQKIFNGIIIF